MPERERCRKEVVIIVGYNPEIIRGGKLIYERRQCKRLSKAYGYCWQHEVKDA